LNISAEYHQNRSL